MGIGYPLDIVICSGTPRLWACIHRLSCRTACLPLQDVILHPCIHPYIHTLHACTCASIHQRLIGRVPGLELPPPISARLTPRQPGGSPPIRHISTGRALDMAQPVCRPGHISASLAPPHTSPPRRGSCRSHLAHPCCSTALAAVPSQLPSPAEPLPSCPASSACSIPSAALAALGADMYDSVYPTRTARFGVALVPQGVLKLKNAAYVQDYR